VIIVQYITTPYIYPRYRRVYIIPKERELEFRTYIYMLKNPENYEEIIKDFYSQFSKYEANLLRHFIKIVV